MRLGFLAVKHGSIPPQPAYVIKIDEAQQLMLIRYLTATREPSEVVRLDGFRATPAFTKTTAIVLLCRPWLYERDLWVPLTSRVSVEVNGELLRLEMGSQRALVYETTPQQVWQRFARSSAPPAPHQSAQTRDPSRQRRPIMRRALRTLRRLRRRRAVRGLRRPRERDTRLIVPLGLTAAQLRRAARSPAIRHRFADAWVLVDRDTMAGDNAEAFHRYLARITPKSTRGLSCRPRPTTGIACRTRASGWSTTGQPNTCCSWRTPSTCFPRRPTTTS